MSPTGINPKTRRFAQRLRREQTKGESALWRALRELKAEGIRVRRQAPIGSYVADFVVFSNKRVIEIDGDLHGFPARKLHDAKRDAWLQKEGFDVLRFQATEVEENLEGVVTAVRLRLGLEVTGYPHP
ncbi:endonuclease domain-containing protein [Roseibium sediminicola]|uniref:DUF559 domain-containing protein n=1 Tax=Roseibium sediminicola TaxID=2933272 RepID=A0ABT0H0W5_9HYPH|nr:DUF559 domain-containing protein [Roseibium sp. CAU 1639]